MAFDPSQLSSYPHLPGVYLMKNSEGRILYIGKAKNLRTRLKQYFIERADERKMVPYLRVQVETIDTLVTLTEKEALLLENNLIKQHRPKYNILLKDDKTYISIALTRHQWPMLKLVRCKGAPSKALGALFGPYTNAGAARQMLNSAQSLFPLRQCSDAELNNRVRPCLLYDIKRCLAPCVKKVSAEEYGSLVEKAARFLRGSNQEALLDLKEKMECASKELRFEEAARYLQEIKHLEISLEQQHVENSSVKNCDVIGIHSQTEGVLIALLIFREGKMIGSEHFSFHEIVSDEAESLHAFLLQHYTQENCPEEIILPRSLNDHALLEEILSDKAGRKVVLVSAKHGKKKALISMAARNAESLAQRAQEARSLKEKLLLDLQETLQLTRFPKRIECLDTSHLSGNHPMAAFVCFINGERIPRRQRLFAIKEGTQGDDYGAMRQVLEKHFTKQKEKADFCDLLIVDGGKGHLGLALEVFEKLGIASIDAIALTKEEARHDKGLTQEKVFIPYQNEPLLIPVRSPLLFFLQRIRDEAHRAAIGAHRRKRGEDVRRSALDSIPGIGPKKKRSLLRHFGSLQNMQRASPEALGSVPGLSKKDIENLSHFLRSNEPRR